MSIVKNTPHILKHSKSTFTTLLNKTLEAIKDPATLGIYVYLSSKPHDWEISETNLKNRFGKGRDFIRSKLTELKHLGLLKSQSIKNDKGQIIRWETILFNEIQITENPPSGYPTHVVDPPTTNKRNKEIKEINKTPISPSGSKMKTFSLSHMLEDNPFNIPENVLSDWLEVRKAKKSKITSTAWEQVKNNLTKLKAAGLCPIECFLKAVGNGWCGVEFRYFDKDIESLKPKQQLKYTPKEDRGAEYEKITARELAAENRKKEEIEASKGFLNLVKNSVIKKPHINIHELKEKQEKERNKLGMTLNQYHEHVLINFNNSNQF